MVLSTLIGVAYFFFIIFQCGAPIQGATFWHRFIAHKCQPDSAVLAMGYTHAIITALTDATCAILPILFLRRSKLDLGKKFIVGVILVIGAIGGIASIVRVTYIKALTNPGLDFLCKMLSLALWSALEPGLGIIAASLATLRPLLRTISKTFETWKSIETNRSSAQRETGPASEHYGPRMRRSERGFSVLQEDDVEATMNTVDERNAELKTQTNVMNTVSSHSQTSMDKPEKEIAEPQKPKASWWALPEKPFGLVTDFRRATRDIRLENMAVESRSNIEPSRRNG